jgi:hypothetical protein
VGLASETAEATIDNGPCRGSCHCEVQSSQIASKRKELAQNYIGTLEVQYVMVTNSAPDHASEWDQLFDADQGSAHDGILPPAGAHCLL